MRSGEAELTPGVTDAAPVDADSTRVLELQSEFDDGEDQTAVVLYATDGAELSSADVADLERGFTDATGSRAPLQVSEDRTAAIGVDHGGGDRVRGRVGRRRRRSAPTSPATCPDGVSAQVTGPAAIEADLSAVFDGADTRLLLATASVVAVLLILTYRSPILWIVPLAVVGLADRLAAVLATQTLAVVGIPWDESTVGILSVLVFGAGTDYALLLISRYRDELRLHEDRYVAMQRARRRTAEAVLSSASTVVVGVLTLLLCAFPTTRGLGVASAVGHRGRRCRRPAGAAARRSCSSADGCSGRVVPRVGQRTLAESGSFWGRVGRVVARAPGRLIVGSTLLLAVMAAGLTQVQTGLSTSEQFLDEPEAIAAADRLAESFPAGAAEPTVVVTADEPDQVATAVGGGARRDARAGRSRETDGWSKLTVVLDARPGSARGGADACSTCGPRSTGSTRPTSAARRRRRSTRRTPPLATAAW